MTFQMDAIEDDELPPSDPTTATGHTRQFNFVNEAAEPQGYYKFHTTAG